MEVETVREWGFTESDDGVIWSGQVSGPDRLRFLGVLSRYAALLKGIQLEEKLILIVETIAEEFRVSNYPTITLKQ